MSDIPSMPYGDCFFHEKTIKSVESNTREDGREFLAYAKKIPIKPHTTTFHLEKANEPLLGIKQNAIQVTAVLVIS